MSSIYNAGWYVSRPLPGPFTSSRFTLPRRYPAWPRTQDLVNLYNASAFSKGDGAGEGQAADGEVWGASHGKSRVGYNSPTRTNQERNSTGNLGAGFRPTGSRDRVTSRDRVGPGASRSLSPKRSFLVPNTVPRLARLSMSPSLPFWPRPRPRPRPRLARPYTQPMCLRHRQLALKTTRSHSGGKSRQVQAVDAEEVHEICRLLLPPLSPLALTLPLSLRTPHPSPLAPRPSPLAPHPLPLTTHPSPF